MSTPAADPPAQSAADPSPDWDVHGELACPLCGYNLRGLTTPRCPECGFAFRWAELLAADRNRHPWLFEHGRRAEAARRFAATYGRTGRPRRFWRSVSPANPVRVRRLVAYWLLACLPAAGVLFAPLPARVWDAVQDTLTGGVIVRSPAASGSGPPWMVYGTAPPPPVFSAAFVESVWSAVDVLPTRNREAAAAVVVGWPWLSLVTLSVFQDSMRRAKIRRRHVVRVAVYGCDFGLLMATLVAAYYVGTSWPRVAGWVDHLFRAAIYPRDFAVVVWTVLACAAVATYRLAVAYRRYMRFHLPLATVVASQALAVVAAGFVVFATLLQVF